jgi:pimeloyl-ACP methyl ester carboxylesterase
MADQTTTIAQLPAGYATLGGVIYAVAVTSPKIWSYVAWNRIGYSLLQFWRYPEPKINKDSSSDLTESRASVVSGLLRTITKELRAVRRRAKPSDSLAAKLHVLLLLTHGRMIGDSPATPNSCADGINLVEARRPLRADTDDVPESLEPVADTDHVTVASEVIIEIHHPRDKAEVVRTVGLSVREVIEKIDPKPSLAQVEVLVRATVQQQPSASDRAITLHAQRAATMDVLAVEVAFKAIELLIACGIILGSSGGAWLGLTLASIFPQRVAAGLYVSSVGQVVSRNKTSSLQKVHQWRPAGSIWVEESKGGEKEITAYFPPQGYLSDPWRDALGFTTQYGLLFAVQYFKLRIRSALEFGDYHITRDAIRYIVLVVQVMALVFCGVRIWPKFQKTRIRERRLTEEGVEIDDLRHALWRNYIAATVYGVMLAGGLTCVVLGQKDFLKPIWKFYLASKIVDPFVAVGTAAIMMFDKQKDGRVSAEKWVLMWVLGASAIVW